MPLRTTPCLPLMREVAARSADRRRDTAQSVSRIKLLQERATRCGSGSACGNYLSVSRFASDSSPDKGSHGLLCSHSMYHRLSPLRTALLPPSDEGGGPPSGRVGRRDTAPNDSRTKILQERAASCGSGSADRNYLSDRFAASSPDKGSQGCPAGQSMVYVIMSRRTALLPPSDEGGGSAQR